MKPADFQGMDDPKTTCLRRGYGRKGKRTICRKYATDHGRNDNRCQGRQLRTHRRPPRAGLPPMALLKGPS